jgi:hypothetical protein
MNRRPTRIVEQLDPTSEHVRFIDERGEPVEATFSGSSGTVQLPEIPRAHEGFIASCECSSWSVSDHVRKQPRGREPFKKFFL